MSIASNSASDIDYISCLVERVKNAAGDCQTYHLKASQAIEFSVGLRTRGKGEGNDRMLQQLEDLNSQLKGSVQSGIFTANIPDQHIVRTDFPSRLCSRGYLNADILHEILSFLSCRSPQGRMTLYNASLVSRTFHEAANRHLWRHPRPLTSDDRLKKFAFGAIVSSKLSDSGRVENIGHHTRSIHLEEGKDSRQSRFLISEIGRLAPNLASLSLTLVSPDRRAVEGLLTTFPRLTRLEISASTTNPQHDTHDSTPFETDDEIELGTSAKQILGNLTSFCLFLFKFDGYWDVVEPHLSSNLVDLVISSSDLFNDDGDRYDQLAELSSLVSLEIDCPTLVPDFMTNIIGSLPKLERLTLRGANRQREEWTPDGTYDLVQQAMGLPVMKEFWLSWSIPLQVFTELIADGPSGLEDIRVCIADRDHSEEEVEEAILSLVQEHWESLRVVVISRESGKKFSVHEELLEALALAPRLERVLLPIRRDSVKDVNMVSFVNQILEGCPDLQWTDTLHNLIRSAQSVYAGEDSGHRKGRVYDEEYYLRLESRRNELRQDPRTKRFGRISPYIDFWRLRDVGCMWI